MSFAPQKLGPGHLKFGGTGESQEFGSMTSQTSLEPEVEEQDPTPMLDGSNFVEQGEIGGTLKGTFYQDYTMEGLTAWTWKNMGKNMPFEFRPRDDSDMVITGSCVIKPVAVGGDPNKNNAADFEFKLTSKPVMSKAESANPGA